jgi:diguanylate cyclase (GGDEF)-like protein
VAIWRIIWQVCESSPQIGGVSMFAERVLLPSLTLVLVLIIMIRHELHWAKPARRLRGLLPQIRSGECPIEELSHVGGPDDIGQLIPELQQLFRDLRRQKLELSILNEEMRQRVAQRTDALERAMGSLRTQATRDALTGLGNRRKFDQELARRFAQWRRGGTPLTLVLVDVDHFKCVNDDHGHSAGDAVLHEVAQVLAECVREMDVVARYGGEEFGMILPGTTLVEARPVAERVRNAIAGRAFQYGEKELRITVSAGLAEALLTNDVEVLVARADTALYSAKDAGRDCCHAHDGQNCIPVEKSTAPGRRKSDCRQRIAPFVDGNFPDAEMFSSVECEDLSPVGFTFLAREKPAYDKVLVALDEGKGRTCTSATVQHCRNIGTETAPLYRVTCQFTVPVHQFAEAAAS